MKHSALVALSVIALGLSACGNRSEPSPEATTAGDMTLDTSTADATAASPAQSFADAAAASDAFEIETSRLAAEKASSAKIKAFAQEMIKAHTDSTAKLTTAAAAATPPVTPAPQLNPMQQQTLDSLRTKSGADFDTAYKQAQVDAHQATLDALKVYSASGDSPSLKAFAGELVPVVTAHLNRAKGL